MSSRILPVLTLLALSGCVAYELPEQQAQLVAEPLFKERVNLRVDGNYGDEWLAKALVSEGLSNNIVTRSDAEFFEHSLELKTNHTGKCFSEPMLTAITLGVIPSLGCAEVGYIGEFRSQSTEDIYTVNTESEMKTVFGLLAWPLLLSPNWVGERGRVESEAQALVTEIARVRAR